MAISVASPIPPTSLTLLPRRQSQQVPAVDWRRSLQIDASAILDGCRGDGLQVADLRDRTPEVWLRVSRCLAVFRCFPGKSVRGWLRTIRHHGWGDWQEAREPGGTELRDATVSRLWAEIRARDDLARRSAQPEGQELPGMAMERMRAWGARGTGRAVELSAWRHVPGTEATRPTGTAVASMFVAHSKRQRRMREDLDRLRARDGSS
jgi:hypothetical protein